MIEQVAEVVGPVLDRPGHAPDRAEGQRVARLEQLPAGAGEPRRAVRVEDQETETLSESAATAAQWLSGQPEAGEASLMHATQERVDLPGGSGCRIDEHGQRIVHVVR